MSHHPSRDVATAVGAHDSDLYLNAQRAMVAMLREAVECRLHVLTRAPQEAADTLDTHLAGMGLREQLTFLAEVRDELDRQCDRLARDAHADVRGQIRDRSLEPEQALDRLGARLAKRKSHEQLVLLRRLRRVLPRKRVDARTQSHESHVLVHRPRSREAGRRPSPQRRRGSRRSGVRAGPDDGSGDSDPDGNGLAGPPSGRHSGLPALAHNFHPATVVRVLSGGATS